MSAPGQAQIKTDALNQELWQIAEAGVADQLEQVLARGADVNACNDCGVTALMVAAYHGRLEMVRALVEHGADRNAEDSDGFTAGMLADHAGHDEIVRTLVALGVKRGRKSPAPETAPTPIAQKETSDDADPDVPPTDKHPDVRTLHEPPEIWDLVHETRTEFKPGSAFVGHLTALRSIVLAAVLLIIAGGAVFWFIKVRGGAEKQTSAPATQAESGNTKTDSSRQSPLPNTASSSDQQSNSLLAPTNAADNTTRAGAADSTTRTEAGVSTIDVVETPVAAPAASTGRKVVAKPRRQNPESSKGLLADTGNKDGGQPSTLVTGTSPTPAADNKDGAKESNNKSENEKSADPKASKKQADKALSPQLIAPAKAAPTPKAKVIPWP